MKRVSVVFLLSIFIFTKFSFVSGNMVSDMVKVYGELGRKPVSSIHVSPSQGCFYDNHLMDALIRHVNGLVRESMGVVERYDFPVWVNIWHKNVTLEGVCRLATEITGVRYLALEGLGKEKLFGCAIEIVDDKFYFKFNPSLSCGRQKARNFKEINAGIREYMDMLCLGLGLSNDQYEVQQICWCPNSYFWARSFSRLFAGIKNLKQIAMIGSTIDGSKYARFMARLAKFFPKTLECLFIDCCQLDDSFFKNLKLPGLKFLSFYGGKGISCRGLGRLAKNCPQIEHLYLCDGRIEPFFLCDNVSTLRKVNFSEMKCLKRLQLPCSEEEMREHSELLEQEKKTLSRELTNALGHCVEVDFQG